MTGLLAQEILQTKPFGNPSIEAYLNLVRTTEVLTREVATVFRRHDLTQAQYNILRILRGAGTDGLACQAIGKRLVTLDPDVTRLLDKLEQRGLVARERQHDDRRVVLVRLTAAGTALCDDPQLTADLTALHHQHFARLGPSDTATLIRLLETLRTPAVTSCDADSPLPTGSPAA